MLGPGDAPLIAWAALDLPTWLGASLLALGLVSLLVAAAAHAGRDR